MKASKKMTRGILIAAVLFAANACRSWAAATELQCPNCNVILVMIDVLRADELRPAGAGKEIMPNLDALAARSIVFSNAFSPSPDTTPSSISIISGLYPWHHGARVPLRDKAIQDEWTFNANNIVGVLRSRGYEIRKTDLPGSLNIDTLLGKDLSLGQAAGALDLGGKKFFLLVKAAVHDPYFPSYDDVRALDPSVADRSYPSLDDVFRCELASEMAKKLPRSLRGIDSIEASPLPDQMRRVVESDPAQRLRAVRELDELSHYLFASQCYWSFFSSSTIATARLLYDADARAIDRALGELMSNLEKEGLLKNSLVIVTSQHGEEFLEHGKVTHSQQVYDESLHVPFILLLPGLRTGRVYSEISSGVDVLPTILGSLGLEPLRGLDGRDLLRCLRGGCGKRSVFAESNNVYSVRDDFFSYIRHQDDGTVREELYDRRSDPGERLDIASRKAKTLSRMRAAFSSQSAGMLVSGGRWPEWVSEKLREQILKEGYW